MSTSDAELLPCPFCGSAAQWNHNDGAISFESNAGAHWIDCRTCGASTNMRFSLMDDCRPLLAEQWNRRAALPIDFKQATDQGGWQLVPKKPTPAMLDAVMVDEVEAPEFLSLIRDQYAEDYCAMLAAAPTLLGVADGDAVGGKSGGAK